jgi:hypothetical protein
MPKRRLTVFFLKERLQYTPGKMFRSLACGLLLNDIFFEVVRLSLIHVVPIPENPRKTVFTNLLDRESSC